MVPMVNGVVFFSSGETPVSLQPFLFLKCDSLGCLNNYTRQNLATFKTPHN